MARRCSICASPARETIDAALIAEGQSSRAISSRFSGFSRAAIERHHRLHLRPPVAAAVAVVEDPVGVVANDIGSSHPEITALACIVSGRRIAALDSSASLRAHTLRDFTNLGTLADLAAEKGDIRSAIQATLARYVILDRAGLTTHPDDPLRGKIVEHEDPAVAGADFLKALSEKFLIANSDRKSKVDNGVRIEISPPTDSDAM